MNTKTQAEIHFELRYAIEREDWPKIEELVDIGIRHETGVKPIDYLKHWCNVARFFAVATHDYSWGEFEKEFAIIIRDLAKGRTLATHHRARGETIKELSDSLLSCARDKTLLMERAAEIDKLRRDLSDVQKVAFDRSMEIEQLKKQLKEATQ